MAEMRMRVDSISWPNDCLSDDLMRSDILVLGRNANRRYLDAKGALNLLSWLNQRRHGYLGLILVLNLVEVLNVLVSDAKCEIESVFLVRFD